MKKSFIITLLISVAIIFTMLSCEQPKNEVPVQEYSTPTIKGTLSLPAGSTVNPGDIYVKVIDSTGATAKVQKANSDKTFVVQGLNADMSYSILFSSVEPEFTNRSISRDPDKSNGVGGWIHDVKPAIKEGNDIGSVKLKPLGTIRGKALIDGKAEHYDTTVYIPGTSYIAMTSADGTFAIYNVPEGTYTLRYTHEGYMPIMTEGVILTCPEDAENPEITTMDVKLVSSSGTVEGVALFDGLTSHSGITIKLESEDRNKAAQASTSEDGSYIFNDVAPGVYRVIVSASGYVSMSSGYFTVESATLTSVPERTVLYGNVGSVKGTVKLSDSQADSSGIVVSFVSNEDSFTAVTDNDGYFSRSLKPGSYTVTASYPGYTSQSLDVTVTENALTEINLPSLPLASGAVAGFVVLAGSEDFSGVVITLTNSTAMTESYTAVTATDGSFRFTGLNKGGTYLLTYSKDGYVSDNSKSIDVTVGSVANAGSVTLKSTFATVKGTIQLEGASSYENVTILLKNDSNQYTSTTDQKGGYVINRILPGTYTLLASKDGYVTGQITEIVIEPSSDKQADLLSLSVAIKSVTGSVELELATDHAGVLVTATNLSDNKLIYSAITNSSGNFTLAGMKSGEYSVVLSCTGYNTIMLPTINVVDTTVYTIARQNMEISRGKIAGLVRLEGYSDHSGVKVSMLGTDYVTTTASDGSFEFNVPAANYPGGLRFEKEDMQTAAYAETIPVIVNSTYALKHDVSLSAVNVPEVKGIVKVGGTDDWSGVTVRLVDRPEYAVVTGSDGTWCFEHVPLGKYTLEYTRENAKKITSVLNVTAGPVITASTLTIIPDSASIEGHIALASVSDYSGVRVSVKTSGVSLPLSTTTDSTGYFYIGNLLSSGTHTVSIEKAGWSSVTIELSNLEPLSLTDITTDDAVVLIDTTAPSLNSVSINSGANATGSRKVNISVNAEDEGSGITLMQYSWTDNFDASSWLNYASSFDVTIPDEVNGTKTLRLRVKDNAGNVSSIVSDSIDLVGQIQSIGGTLSVDDLHWEKENNPYVVTSDLIIPEGRTLVIDPGVDVLFDGNYSILIRGTLSAVGTENDPIVFRSTRDYMTAEYDDESYSGYDGNWGGISAGTNSFSVNTDTYDFELNNGSELSYCNIQDIGTGIRGNIYVSNCIVISDRYAIGDNENRFTGALLNSRITGSAFLGENSIVYGNEFSASNVSFIVPSYANYSSSGNYYWWSNAQGWSEYYYVDDQRLEWYDEQGFNHVLFHNRISSSNCRLFVNNKINRLLVYINNYWGGCIIQFITFEDCKFRFYDTVDSILEYCEFKNNQNSIEFGYLQGISFSNFIDNTNRYLLKTNSKYTQRSTHDMRFNYWDSANTRHLDSISNSSNPNVNFFYDGIDNIDLSVINYSGYVSSPWAMAGYQGDKFCDVQASYVKQGEYEEAKVGSNIDIDLDLLTDGSISYYRVAQSLDDLISSGWIPYYGSACFLGSSVDYGKLEDGYLGLYLQVKTSDGVESPVKSLRVGYDIPVINSLSIKDGEVINKDNKISIQLTSSNAGRWYYIDFYIDDKYVTNITSWSGNNEVSNVIDPVTLLNGEHKLSIKLIDQFGDSSETVLNFTIDRPLPVVTDVSLENEVLAKDEVLSLSVSATNTKHLQQIRIYMDGVQIGYQDYEDNGSSTVIEEFSVEPQYLKDGTHSLYVVLEDYTGNTTTSDSFSIEVQSDNSKPPVVLLPDLVNGVQFTKNAIVAYDMTVSDEGGISSLDIILDGKTSLYHFYDSVYREAYKNIDVTLRLRIPYYSNGEHTIAITATDFAGNISEESRSFSINRELPYVYSDYSSEYPDRNYLQFRVSPNSSWIYDGALYIDNIPYSYNLFSYGVNTDNWLESMDIYYNRLTSGVHTAQYKARLQSGEIIESDRFTVTGSIPESKDVYGEGVTWNHNGTLIKDPYTYYLWNFDSSDRAKEVVSGKRLGSVSDTVSGFGDRAARMYLDLSNMKMQFPNSSWTLEFWYENNNTEANSGSNVQLKNIFNSCINKNSTSNSSNINTDYFYQDMNSDVGSIWSNIEFSRYDASSWHHYALVSDGSSFMVYIDGMMRYKTDGDKPSVKISDGLYISMPDKAYIDELRISNKARSADELWDYNEFVRERNIIPQ